MRWHTSMRLTGDYFVMLRSKGPELVCYLKTKLGYKCSVRLQVRLQSTTGRALVG